jgi:hypothetical protein
VHQISEKPMEEAELHIAAALSALFFKSTARECEE